MCPGASASRSALAALPTAGLDTPLGAGRLLRVLGTPLGAKFCENGFDFVVIRSQFRFLDLFL